jgi:hypothetical protein
MGQLGQAFQILDKILGPGLSVFILRQSTAYFSK